LRRERAEAAERCRARCARQPCIEPTSMHRHAL
jgi:hypothetical protein